MRNKSLRYSIGICLFFCCISSLWAQGIKTDIRQAYKDGMDNKIEAAALIYQKILAKDSLSAYANYGMGIVRMKQKDPKGAIGYYERIKGDTTLTSQQKHDLYHNLGNAYYITKNYQKAVEAFENSLIANPKDDQTRYNLVMAQKMLKKQQNKKNNQNKQQNNKNNKDKKNKDKNKDNKDNKNKNKPNKGNDKQKQPQQPKPQPGQISKQEALQLLKSFKQDDDRTRQELLKKQKRNQAKNQDKNNW